MPYAMVQFQMTLTEL